MIYVKNTDKMRALRDVSATLAIEGMGVSKEFISEMIKAANGEKTNEELRQEVLKRYVR